MSSNASTTESGASAESVTATGIDTGEIATADVEGAAAARTKFDVEREILCNYIEELERELVRERQRRERVVERYERLLEAERRTENESATLFDRLF